MTELYQRNFPTCLPSGRASFRLRRSVRRSYIYAADGRRYLDFTCGIGVTNTGHCHPKVVEAVREQAGLFLHAQANIVVHQPMLRMIGRTADDSAAGNRRLLLQQLRRGGGRGRAQTGAFGHRAAVRHRLHRQFSWLHRSDDDADHLQDLLQRPIAVPSGRGVRRAVPVCLTNRA